MTRPWQCPTCAPAAMPEPRWAPGPAKELDAGSVVVLLDDLHERLRRRRDRAALYVVGGSALLLVHSRDLATADVDVARCTIVEETTREIARERGLAMTWLNAGAAPWVPAGPPCSRATPDRDGLTVHVAPPRHLLAMKLVSWRPTDEDDLADLLAVCGLTEASADEVADVLYEVYDREDELAGHLGVPRSDPAATRKEAVLRSQQALDLL